MLVFEEREKQEYLRNNLSEQRREPTNSSHLMGIDPATWVGLGVLSPLRHQYSLLWKGEIFCPNIIGNWRPGCFFFLRYQNTFRFRRQNILSMFAFFLTHVVRNFVEAAHAQSKWHKRSTSERGARAPYRTMFPEISAQWSLLEPSFRYLSPGREGEKCRPLDHVRQIPFIHSAQVIICSNLYICIQVFLFFPAFGTSNLPIAHVR